MKYDFLIVGSGLFGAVFAEQCRKNNKKVLTATQHGKFIDFNSKNMFKFLYYNPLLGFKVMAGILYEALKIIYKGGKYYARKKKPNDTVSFEGNF